jgi:hypothetical protein
LAVRNSHPQTNRRIIPAHKENKHEAGRTKKFAQAQEKKEAPCYEEVHSGEEIKGCGSVKFPGLNCIYFLGVVRIRRKKGGVK